MPIDVIVQLPRKVIVHRATMAPSKRVGDWTLGDFRQFVQDCEILGITDETRIFRESPFAFGDEGGRFIAERHTSAD